MFSNNRFKHKLGEKKGKGFTKNTHYEVRSKDTCGIFVTGFPETADENDLLNFFSKCGQIKDHYLDHNKKFLMVGFKNSQDAYNVLKKPQFFQGRRLIIKYRNLRKKDFEKVETITLDCNKILNSLKDLEQDFDYQVKKFLSSLEMKIDPNKNYCELQNDLQKHLKNFFPNCQLHRFGSTLTELNWYGSDIDFYCEINNDNEKLKQEDLVNKVRNYLSNNQKFSKVFALPKARIPIVQLIHVPTRISCDISFRNMFGVLNSKFIAYCMSLDHRFKTLMFILKFWSKTNGYSSGSGKISNYMLTMLFLFYLQQKYEFPSISSMIKPTEEKDYINHWNPYFKTDSLVDLSKIKTESLKNLLCGFFELYSTFDFSLYVISLFLGKPILKVLFLYLEQLPLELECYKNNVKNKGVEPLPVDKDLCVQDPFELNVNLSKGTHLKLLQTFVQGCKTAVNVLNNNSLKNVLFNLFNEKSNFRFSEDMINNKTIKVTLHSQQNAIINLLKSNEINEKTVILAWFEFYKEFLIKILKDVLLLNIEDENSSVSNKITRQEGQEDVHYNSKSDITFVCSGNNDILTSRNTVKVDAKTCKNILEKEAAISQLLSQKQVPRNEKIVKFEINLSYVTNPTEIYITMNKILTVENYYNKIVGYMTKAFNVTIGTYINQTYQPSNIKRNST